MDFRQYAKQTYLCSRSHKGGSSQTITKFINSFYDFNTSNSDTTGRWIASSGAFNSATGNFATTNPGYLVAESGNYTIICSIHAPGATRSEMFLYKGVTQMHLAGNESTAAAGANLGMSANLNVNLPFVAGDILYFQYYCEMAGASLVPQGASLIIMKEN